MIVKQKYTDDRSKEYLLLGMSIGLCPECLEKVEVKIIETNGMVFLDKHCSTHGFMRHVLEEDAEFYKKQFMYQKPGTVCKTQTKLSKSCPYDCGLCSEHEQHTCIGLIEVTNKCNLKCPVCYANSGEGDYLNIKMIEKMMDFYQDTSNPGDNFANSFIRLLSDKNFNPLVFNIT